MSSNLEYAARSALAVAYVATLGIHSTHRLKGALHGYALQSLALAVAAGAHGRVLGVEHALTVALLFALTKAVIAPRVLALVIERLDVKREIEMFVEVPWSLFVGAAGLGLAYVVGAPLAASLGASDRTAALFEADAIIIGLALVISGFFLMVARRKLVTQMIGLLVMENGIFMGAVGLAHGLPLAVELGAAADVFMAVLILGLLVFRMNAQVRSGDADRFRRLRG